MKFIEPIEKSEIVVRQSIATPIHAYMCSLWMRLIPKGSLQNRFAGAAFWSLFGVAVSNAAGLLTAAMLARLMGREGYGEVGVITSTYVLFSQLGGLGLGVTAIKYAAQLRGTESTAVGRLLGSILVLSSLSYAIAALVVMVFAPELAVMLNRPILMGAIRASGIVLLIQGIDSIQSGILAGYEEFRAIARVTMLRAAINLPLTILGAHLYGIYGVVGAMIISGFFSLFLNRNALNRILMENHVYLWFGVDLAKLNLLWEFSLPTFISATLTMASNWALNAILVNQSNGYVQMGLFNAANQWRALGILVPGVCNSVVLSIQSNLHATKNYASHHRSVTGNLIVQCVIAALVVGVIAGLSPYLIKIYGSKYEASGELLMLLSLGWFFLTPNWILWNAAISSGKAWWGLLFNVIGTGSLLVFAMHFVDMGAKGIALALLYSGIIQVGLQSIYYYVTKQNDKSMLD